MDSENTAVCKKMCPGGFFRRGGGLSSSKQLCLPACPRELEAPGRSRGWLFLMLPIGKERATPQVWARPATAPPALTRRSCEGYGPLRALGVPVTLCLQCRTVVHAAPTVSFLTKMAGLQIPKESPAPEVAASSGAFCSPRRVTRPTGASWAGVGSVGVQLGPEPDP